MVESDFQSHLIKRMRKMFPGCVIMKNDSGYMQGVPDLTILYGLRWACLEVKTSSKYRPEPNQPYYIHLLNEMSFAAFIFPENEEEVMRGLQLAFEPPRSPRFPQSK